MYLAEYNIGGVAWHQLAASIAYPSPDDPSVTGRWWTRFRTLLRNLDAIREATTSLRLAFDDGLLATVFVTAPASQTQHVRRAFGSLTQLDLVADSKLEFPANRSAHDEALRFPRFRCPVALPSLTSGSAWFAFDFRAHDHLNELMLEARALEHAFSYHVNVAPLTVDPEWQRLCARNALRVSETAGVPSALEALQQTMAAKLGSATHICEEFLGVDDPGAREWLRDALARTFRRTYGAHVAADFRFDGEEFEGSLTATRHRMAFETLRVDEIVATAVGPAERVRLLSWEPTGEVLALFPRPAGPRSLAPETPPDQPLDERDLPRRQIEDGPFIFISYKRQDWPRIRQQLLELDRRGYRLWYDRDIPGGSEWDALIEDRLQTCSAVVVFVSRAAVESKFVRRELKFADALNKPIVPIRIEADVVLTHGLALLFNQYQIIDAGGALLDAEIARALRAADSAPSRSLLGSTRS